MVRSGGSTRHRITVLCVACSAEALAGVRRDLSHSRIQILTATSRDHAVALCLSHSVSVVLIGGECIRGEELSLAAALKLVRPFVPVILLEERRRPGTDLPQNVDVIVQSPEDLLKKMNELLKKSGAIKPALPV
jgi:chemotaxis response regulator CheB